MQLHDVRECRCRVEMVAVRRPQEMILGAEAPNRNSDARKREPQVEDVFHDKMRITNIRILLNSPETFQRMLR